MVSCKSWTANAPSELWKSVWRKNGKSMVSRYLNQTCNDATDRNRDWALRRAEELGKQHAAASSKAVLVERGSSTRERGIYVEGVRVFEQVGRFSKDGVFLHAFARLSLR